MLRGWTKEGYTSAHAEQNVARQEAQTALAKMDKVPLMYRQGGRGAGVGVG